MTVTVFTNPSNPQCKATEQELSKLGVRYVAVDLTQNPSTFEHSLIFIYIEIDVLPL